MLEFVQALHEAFHTESRWLFVLYLALSFAVLGAIVGGALAYVVDSGWQRKLRESRSNTVAPPTPAVIRDTAEEERLRAEISQLKARLDDREKRKKNREQVGKLLAEGNDLKGQCDTLEERPYLERKASDWVDRTFKALQAIDISYAARFQNPSGPSYSRTLGNKPLPQINQNVWNFVNLRTEALNRILETMPN